MERPETPDQKSIISRLPVTNYPFFALASPPITPYPKIFAPVFIGDSRTGYDTPKQDGRRNCAIS
jgi:hypothetical protein